MNRESLIADIRKACIEANPSIIELGFGCQILFEVEPYNSHNLHRRKDDVFVVIDESPDAKILGNFEILGRKTGLADIFLAIGNTNMSALEIQKAVVSVYNNYELEKDDLTLQSTETLQFIASLLKV